MVGAAPFVGIDFGTTNSSVAWFNPQARQAEVLLNTEGEAKTPSLVYFGEPETLVGKAVENLLNDLSYEDDSQRQEVQRVVKSIKRHLLTPPLIALPGERMVRPVDVAAAILHKLKGDAEALHFHDKVARAVITCPAVFDTVQREQIMTAAAIAGFEIVLLEEPVAAALAFGHAGQHVGQGILVYDLGGGTFDLAVVVREDDETFRVAMETDGDPHCGGDDFDQALYDYWDAQAQRELGCSVSPMDGAINLRFLAECRRRKEYLTVREQFTSSSLLPGGQIFKLAMDRATLTTLIGDRVEQTVRKTITMLERAQAQGYTVDTVVLIGGSARLPLVRELLEDALRTRQLAVSLHLYQHQDVAVALGAAYHAQTLWGETVGPAPTASEVTPERLPALAEPPAEAQALVSQAHNLTKQGQMELAFRRVQEACDLAPHWAAAFFLKGHILKRLGEWRAAIVATTRCLELYPQHWKAYELRALCKLQLSDYAGAKSDTDEILGQPQEDVHIQTRVVSYLMRAIAHADMDEYAMAVADLQEAHKHPEVYKSSYTATDEYAAAFPDPQEVRKYPDLYESLTVPLGAVHAVEGMLLVQALHAPASALACFAEALKAIPKQVGKAYQEQCDTYCRYYGLEIADPPTKTVQHALWDTCKALYIGCSRQACEVFALHCTQEMPSTLWEKDHDFAFHMASISAEQRKASNVISWLNHLITVQPDFDIRQAMQDSSIKGCTDAALRAFLTPQYSYIESHGSFFNGVTITNKSAWRISSIQVCVTVERNDGKTTAPIIKQHAALRAGESQQWDDIFPDAGFFGRKINRVTVSLTCAEGPAQHTQ